MKKIHLALVCLFLSVSNLIAQPALPKTKRAAPKKGFVITGHFAGLDPKKSHLFNAYFLTDFIETNGAAKTDLHLDSIGNFTFRSPVFSGVGRFGLYNKELGWLSTLGWDQLLVEPGDSIHIETGLRTNDRFTFNPKITGRGSAKFNCRQDLEDINFPENQHIYDRMKSGDSILKERLFVLNAYKPRLSSKIYELLKADLVGKVYSWVNNQFQAMCSQGDSDLYSRKELIKAFPAFLKDVSRYQFSDATMSSSLYFDFLHELEISKYGFKNPSQPDLLALKKQIIKNYSESTRDKLLAYNLTTFKGRSDFYIEPDVVTSYLKEAIALARDPYVKRSLIEDFTIGKGANPYNFDLPVDSSNYRLQLSDLKGKVVIIDMWSYICTGCYKFATTFHQKIYPLFKDDHNFKMVSVMAGKDRNAYLHRLRGQDADGKPLPDGVHYTYPDYVNVWAGKTDMTIMQHYHVYEFPFVMVIDKKGKIYNSTATGFPYFTDADSPNVQKLTDLLKRLLAEPD